MVQELSYEIGFKFMMEENGCKFMMEENGCKIGDFR